MDIFVEILLGLSLFVGIALTAISWEAWRSNKMISQWAEENGYDVLTKKQPLVNLGPFRWQNPHGRTFYHVMVRDVQGQTYSGWICCGVEWLGLLSNRVEVRWDVGQPPQNGPHSRQVDERVWPPPPQ